MTGPMAAGDKRRKSQENFLFEKSITTETGINRKNTGLANAADPVFFSAHNARGKAAGKLVIPD